MQRVINRTTLARNQAVRKARIQQKKARRLDFVDCERERVADERAILDSIRDERARRREDWMKGPIAPNRDSGLLAGAYGTVSPVSTFLPTVPKHMRKRFINIAAGDNVVILKGPNQGRICEVSSVSIERESVTLKDENRVDVKFPDWMKQMDNSNEQYMTIPMPISIDDVRLVCTMKRNGKRSEVIAKHVYGAGPYLQRSNAQTPRHTRYISGENIPIPWPEETKVDIAQDEDGDTSRKEVEYETWIPSLMRMPFTSSVIDELRNKYSKYRTRHDPQWEENQKLADLRAEYLKSRTLLTPVGEQKARLAKRKEAIRQSKLDEDGNYIMDASTSAFIANFIGKKGQAAAQ